MLSALLVLQDIFPGNIQSLITVFLPMSQMERSDGISPQIRQEIINNLLPKLKQRHGKPRSFPMQIDRFCD